MPLNVGLERHRVYNWIIIVLTKHFKKKQAKQEVLLYLIATEECIYPKSEINPLDWWQENKHIYPNVAKGARMWLSAPVTSTPSERVFLICDIVGTQ